MDVSEAATLTGLSEGAIRSRIERKTLPAERHSGKVLIPLLALYEKRLIPVDVPATVAELIERVEDQARQIGRLEERLRSYEERR